MTSRDMPQRETVQRIDGWAVTCTWDDQVSTLGPARIVVEPAEGADWYATAGGISSTVLRQIAPERPAGFLAARDDRARELLAFASNAYGPSTDEYLAALANAYVTVAEEQNPGGALAEITGKSVSTVKAHVQAARKRGFLTTIPHRAGGALTHEAAEPLSRVIKAANSVAEWLG